jgi:transcriptional regulator with XRE-family HTH domain
MSARPEAVFAAAMRTAREQAGLSQERLAEVLQQAGHDFDAVTILRMEKGQRRIRLDEAVAVASTLGLQLPAMFLDTGVLAAAGQIVDSQERITKLRAELASLAGEVLGAENEAIDARNHAEDLRHRHHELQAELAALEAEAAAAAEPGE